MEDLDLAVMRTLYRWRLAGQPALLATVTHTWGSSPRPPGSVMALGPGGLSIGSVSGGCIEDDLASRYAARLALPTAATGHAAQPEVLTYGIDADEAHRFGLPCGGTLRLFVEHDPAATALAELLARLDAGELAARRVSRTDGHADLVPAPSGTALEVDDTHVTRVFGPQYRMLLIGAGQLSEFVASMALACGFAVSVCDPREEQRRGWRLAGATLLEGMPDDAVRDFRADARSCVIALTHDPKLDDLALLEALESPAFFVGAIGSRRNSRLRRQRLREHFGLGDAQLSRLHSPVGLAIGSKTPAEIAVSVMAQVVALKNGAALPRDAAVATASGRLPAEPPPARRGALA